MGHNFLLASSNSITNAHVKLETSAWNFGKVQCGKWQFPVILKEFLCRCVYMYLLMAYYFLRKRQYVLCVCTICTIILCFFKPNPTKKSSPVSMYTVTLFYMVLPYSMDLPYSNQFSKDGHFVSSIFLSHIVLQWLLMWTASEKVVWKATTSEGYDMEISGVVIFKEADNRYFQLFSRPDSLCPTCSSLTSAVVVQKQL